MYYIGISAYYHESSVFLTNNEDVNCFLKEESFSRIKGDKNFPKRSLKFLIKKFELKKENIKFICFYEKPFKTWWEIFYFSIKNPLQKLQIDNTISFLASNRLPHSGHLERRETYSVQ